jgi:hypothetical protein
VLHALELFCYVLADLRLFGLESLRLLLEQTVNRMVM